MAPPPDDPADKPASPKLDTGLRNEVEAMLFGSVASADALVPRGSFVPEGGQVGRFVILRKLGEGGMGVVYAAYDNDLDRRVAIKRPTSLRSRPTAMTTGTRSALGWADASRPPDRSYGESRPAEKRWTPRADGPIALEGGVAASHWHPRRPTE